MGDSVEEYAVLGMILGVVLAVQMDQRGIIVRGRHQSPGMPSPGHATVVALTLLLGIPLISTLLA